MFLWVAAVWLLTMSAGLGWMWRYAGSAGEKQVAPEMWPVECKAPRSAGMPVLMVFAHPRCPCSRATLGELALIMARAKGRVQAQVWFYRPANVPDEWTHTDLWDSAAKIPGVSVAEDDGGAQAALFHATVSGQTLLYSVDGSCLFNGGITGARGHSGDNAGRTAVLALLHGETFQRVEIPVFGCALSGSESSRAPTSDL